MPSSKLKRLGKSRRCVVKRRGRKSIKLAKLKTRRYMTKKRVYKGGVGMFEFLKSDDRIAKEAAEAAEKTKADAAKKKADAEKAKADAEKAIAEKVAASEKAAEPAKAKAAAAAEAAKAVAATAAAAKATAAEAATEAAAAPRDASKALKALKATKTAKAAASAAAAAEATAAEAASAAAAAVVSNNPGWRGEYDGPVAAAIGRSAGALRRANETQDAATKAKKEAIGAAEAAEAAEREYVKNQMSQFSRTTLPFMKFLYADASVPVPTDVDLQQAYKQDKELKAYQITSVDEVKMIDLAKYKKYLRVFLTPMFEEFETTMDKPVMLKQIVATEFTQEAVEFTGFLNAIIAIKGLSSIEEQVAALPEALFEAFSKLSDPRYVMLIFESVHFTKDDSGDQDDVYSYSKINKTGKVVNTPHGNNAMDFRVVNGYNSTYLWTLLSRNYYDFYSVIIDKMFPKSKKITFEEFIKMYNDWTLKKSKEAEDTVPIVNDYKMSNWISTGKKYERRLYLRPFETLSTSKLAVPIYDDDQRDSEKVILPG